MPKNLYEPLLSEGQDGHHIRHVTLPPLENIGEVTCSITSSPLEKSPRYQAVSYCWGDQNHKASISCNSHPLLVPASVIPFLRMMARGKEKTLWIDSICINQADDDEKAAQVQLMREIYQKAARTFIWLGEESADSTVGLDFAKKLYNLYVENQKPLKMLEKLDKDVSNPFSAKWPALFRILDRPWWTRAWAVQELAVSTDPWLVCGRRAIPWSMYAGAIFYALAKQPWVFEFYSVPKINAVFELLISQSQISKGISEKHYEVLLRHRRALASNSLDHVYAFYGLSCRGHMDELGIVPKYKNKTPRDVFLALAKSTLERSTNLDFLGVPRLPPTTESPRLPSWVPDWSVSEPVCFSLMQHEMISSNLIAPPPYNATLSSACTDTIVSNDNKLRVHGYILDSVSNLSQPWILELPPGSQSIYGRAKLLQHNQSLVYDFIRVLNSPTTKRYHTSESLDEITWQICVAGFPNLGEDTMRKAFGEWEKRQRFLRALKYLGLHGFVWVYVVVVALERMLALAGYRNPEMEFRKVVGAMLFRSSMRTTTGMLGLAPGLAREGDKLVLLRGGKLPFVLRRQGNYYELIGEVYVHGIMNGEAWEAILREGKECEEIWLQ